MINILFLLGDSQFNQTEQSWEYKKWSQITRNWGQDLLNTGLRNENADYGRLN